VDKKNPESTEVDSTAVAMDTTAAAANNELIVGVAAKSKCRFLYVDYCSNSSRMD
jgi:hypothetical protein